MMKFLRIESDIGTWIHVRIICKNRYNVSSNTGQRIIDNISQDEIVDIIYNTLTFTDRYFPDSKMRNERGKYDKVKFCDLKDTIREFILLLNFNRLSLKK